MLTSRQRELARRAAAVIVALLIGTALVFVGRRVVVYLPDWLLIPTHIIGWIASAAMWIRIVQTRGDGPWRWFMPSAYGFFVTTWPFVMFALGRENLPYRNAWILPLWGFSVLSIRHSSRRLFRESN